MTFAEVAPAVERVLAPIAVVVGVIVGVFLILGFAWFGVCKAFDWMREELE